MDVLACRSPLWEVDDFSICFRQRYLQILFPLVAITVSATFVFSGTIKKWWASVDSVNGYDSLSQSDEQSPFLRRQNSPDSALLEGLHDDSDDYLIYRLSTSDPSRHEEHGVGSSTLTEDDYKLTVVNPRGSNLRIAVEELLIVAEIVLHIFAIISLLWYRPSKVEWEHYGLRALIGTIFWSYTLFLVNLRISISSQKFIPLFLWMHVFAMYSFAWLSAAISYRSSIIHPSSVILNLIAKVDFGLTFCLFVLGLCMSTFSKPIFIESYHGYDPNLAPLASIFSRLTFAFVDPIVWKGYYKTLTISDVWDLQDKDRSGKILKEYRRNWKSTAYFFGGLVKYFRGQVLVGASWSVFHSFFAFVPSIVVKVILEYIEEPEKTPQNVAWLYILLLLTSSILNAMGNGQALWNGREICIRIRAIIIGELYAKALRRKASVGVSKESQKNDDEKHKEEVDSGGIINLMAVDAFKVGELCAYIHFVIGGICMILFSLILLYRTLGPSAIAGAVTMVVLLPLHYHLSKMFGVAQSQLMKSTDKRVQKTNEILSSIKIIKFFAWESRFYEDVNEARADELKKLGKRFFIWALTSVIWYGAPILITCVTFAFYTLVAGNTLTTPIAFSALSLFNLMRIPLDQLAEIFVNVLQSQTSIERIQDFLSESETEKYTQLRASNSRSASSPYIGFENATLSWGTGTSNHEFKLENLNIEFKPGHLTVIFGSTGSGKTSLLMALLGEMKLHSGGVFIPGVTAFGDEVDIDPATGLSESVAYCAQQPWLLNDSVKNNILFGNELDSGRYQAVIEACGLKRDFQILEGGDETEVGDRGIALSGGQKQRISLARALYSPALYLLLDDCLSAVDSHTALHIYENCITGPMMFGRTCILVSHNVPLTLSAASHVIYMDKGIVVQQGSAEEIVNSGLLGDDELIRQSASKATSRNISRNASVANLKKQVDIATAAQINNSDSELSNEVLNDTTTATTNKKKYKLIIEESQRTGTVHWKVYFLYLKALGGFKFWLSVLVAFCIFQYVMVAQSWWIRTWAADVSLEYLKTNVSLKNNNVNFVFASGVSQLMNFKEQALMKREVILEQSSGHSAAYYVSVYAIFTLLYLGIIFIREGVVFFGALNASKSIFENLLSRIMHAKLRFFDANPIGRIMNRFSKDMEITDQEIAPVFVSLGHSLLSIAIIVAIVTFIIPAFLLAAIFISCLFYLVVTFFLTSSRELKRMDAVTRSPIYQHFGETLSGVTTIRAYGYEERFLRENEERIDNNNRPFWSVWACNRWMSFRIDVVGSLVSFATAIFVTLSVGKIDSGLAGLSLTYAVMFTDSLLWFVWLYATNEMNMNSVERIDEYLYIDQEPEEIIENNRPPPGWPSCGSISVDDLSLRYAPGLPPVIKNVSFEVKPNNKIGIVGRTGAGKSTIASAFFRFLEAETGKIVIDGIDISKIGLKDLRSSITIIPQDPTLFTGTVRSNLDPFDYYSDEEVYKSLLRVNLIDSIPYSEDVSNLSVTERHKRRINLFYHLDSPVTEGGGNLSQGQRQLVCLARSLLKSPKVILLDEATASIDYATDAQIQTTIREEFAETTIITIAHRLRSIIDYDMILVLDAGEVKEFAKPHELLQQPDSIFRSMCENSGELGQLEELAQKAYVLQTSYIIQAEN
ncbi:P-loop containing nucleoside triphosphate hydrolase protein [Lipomyces japonicus]|uniref:P-loop containing nucleoside triphosphate hydrolase protein n=1 Tax=Lipomyces japonicus TaxID=56871 RepID=UPI0034D014B6